MVVPNHRMRRGTVLAVPRAMGAIFLLVFLPLTAAIGFMLKTTQGEATGTALLAAVMFVLLCIVMGVGVVRMAREWDEGEADR